VLKTKITIYMENRRKVRDLYFNEGLEVTDIANALELPWNTVDNMILEKNEPAFVQFNVTEEDI